MKQISITKLIITILAVLIAIGLITAIGIYWLWEKDAFFFNSRNAKISEFQPRFKMSNIEMIPGNDYFIYIKTDKIYKVGDLAEVSFLYADYSSETGKYETLSHKVSFVGKGYIGIELNREVLNTECFFAIENHNLTPVYLRKGSANETFVSTLVKNYYGRILSPEGEKKCGNFDIKSIDF